MIDELGLQIVTAARRHEGTFWVMKMFNIKIELMAVTLVYLFVKLLIVFANILVLLLPFTPFLKPQNPWGVC